MTTTNHLHIARERLSLPLRAMLETVSILAVKGAGKTYTFLVVAEELFRTRLPFVILDPVGVCWGLRASANGRDAGLPVVVMGGAHKDLPLVPTAGRIVADFIINSRQSVVLDFSGFDTKADQTRFTFDLLTQLYQKNRKPLAVILDEADEAAPQKPFREEARLLRACEVLVRRGRARGLYPIMATQRAASLNKNVLTQSGALLVGRTTSPQDRKAVKAWVEAFATDDQRDAFMDSLASLDDGEFWIWAPRYRVFKRIHIRQRQTFDSSATPEHGGADIAEPDTLAPVDLKKLSADMQRTVDAAKENDPAELRKTVSELRRQLAAKTPAPAAAPVVRETVKVKTVKVPALTARERKQLATLQAHLMAVNSMAGKTQYFAHGAAETTAKILERLTDKPTPDEATATTTPPRVDRHVSTVTPRPAPARASARVIKSAAAGNGSTPAADAYGLDDAKRRLLAVVMGIEDRGLTPDVRRIAAWLNIHHNGGRYRTNLRELQRDGYLNGYSATATARAVVEPLSPSRSETLAALDEAQRRIVETIEKTGSASVHQIAESLGVHHNGGRFRSNLRRLARMGLVAGEGTYEITPAMGH